MLETIFSILKEHLNKREKEIIDLRFGLGLDKEKSEKKTLEEIGKIYQITRERVRQIEAAAIKRIEEKINQHPLLIILKRKAQRILEEYGGLLREDDWLKEILNRTKSGLEVGQKYSTLYFVAQRFWHSTFEIISETEEWYKMRKLKSVALEPLISLLKEIVAIMEKESKLFKEEEFFGLIKTKLKTNRLPHDKVLVSYLRASKRLGQNVFGDWGMIDSREISPQNIDDKTYLIFKKENRPLHFTEVAELINKANFGPKRAHPATVHNELILDEKYILVGRGLYALKEWGYNKGIVKEIIELVLRKANRPLSKEEIFEAVLKQRVVKKTTIDLALSDKTKFRRGEEGKYVLND